MLILGVLAAGAVGAPLRVLVDATVQHRTDGELALGTIVVNATGSFVLGLLTGLVLYRGFSADARTVLGTGFCGAFTTFSSFAFETVRLVDEGRRADAVRYAVLGVVLPTIAAAIGLALTAW